MSGLDLKSGYVIECDSISDVVVVDDGGSLTRSDSTRTSSFEHESLKSGSEQELHSGKIKYLNFHIQFQICINLFVFRERQSN